MSSLAYKLVKLLIGAVAANVAGTVFQKVWKGISGDDLAPTAGDADRKVTEVLAAGIVQGAIFGLVQAALNRGGAAGVEKLTGEWPEQA